MRGSNAAAVLAKINPIVRGWADYHRGAASSRTFAALDHHLRQLTYKWASPDDPALTDYWARRRGKNTPLLDHSVLILLAPYVEARARMPGRREPRIRPW
ncbi:group II intron maturase-specific domain-containing protein [Dactylosporangium sp. McL0621]|uniref:group II intron maturase-specific domain-containing protein n=1 Tax=Dactylosporangium sp. McL0621 TaxID=3415678 RepID=UPI003CF81A03